MFYTGRTIFPKKAAVLKAMLYAGWAPNQHTSIAVDDIMDLEKNGYRIRIIRDQIHFIQLPPYGANQNIEVMFFNQISFSPKHHYTIVCTKERFSLLTINLLHPEQHFRSMAPEIFSYMAQGRRFLVKYSKDYGHFPNKSTFKKWMKKTFHMDGPEHYIFTYGIGKFWELNRIKQKGTHTQVIPINQRGTRHGSNITPDQNPES